MARRKTSRPTRRSPRKAARSTFRANSRTRSASRSRSSSSSPRRVARRVSRGRASASREVVLRIEQSAAPVAETPQIAIANALAQIAADKAGKPSEKKARF